MEWNGQQLGSFGDLLDAVCAVESREDAHRFMAAYRAETPHAASNVGYLAGYCDSETARRIWDWFECAHPIFGTRIPTADEAFSAGQRLASAYTEAAVRGREMSATGQRRGVEYVDARGSALTTIRENRGLTKAELARRAGISRGILDRLEGSSDGIATAQWRLQAIADALGVSIAQITCRGAEHGVSEAERPYEDCLQPCDDDCELGPVHCEWVHLPSHKPGWHSDEDCPHDAASPEKRQ
jgi:transcriptional regulator with XRE-family HTH domain